MLRRKSSNVSDKEPAQVQKKKLTLQRSSSFKDFMKSKPPSPVVDPDFPLEEMPESTAQVDSGKSGGKLGKKWRNVISRTMTRKTSKMVQKVLAEEGMESSEDGPLSPMANDWTHELSAGNRTSVCSSGSSEDTVHSPLSRQLSGCGDRQSLDSGFSQRDSMRLEDSTYTGPFCGRAQVHTDFIPSPYDVESLKLQKGDIIHIIEKPPVGTWTGKLNNKMGSFKFIYVTMLPDEDSPPQRRRCQSQSHRSKAKPTTLEEVLKRIGLPELSPLFSIHGFQNLEDFGGLKESHLNDLNITDPDQRAKILTATELLHDSEEEADEEDEGTAGKANSPRDSGCFESTENLESKEDVLEVEAAVEPQAEEENIPEEETDVSDVQEKLQELTVEDGS